MVRNGTRGTVAAVLATLLMATTRAEDHKVGRPKSEAIPPTVRQLVERANAAADKRCQTICQEWKAGLARHQASADLQAFAEQVVSMEEKFTRSKELAGISTTDRSSRMLGNFRTFVLDDAALAEEMARIFRKLEGALINESIQLYLRVGIDARTAAGIWKPCELHPEAWQQEFAPVLRKAVEMSQMDWFRTGLAWVGGGVVADAIQDVGHSSGVLPYNRGGLFDAIMGFATQLAVGHVAEQVTDPSERYARELRVDFDAACRRLWDGPSGLASVLRKITAIHQQARRVHLGLVKVPSTDKPSQGEDNVQRGLSESGGVK